MQQGQALINETKQDTSLTADQTSTLTDSCSILRWTRVADGYGSQTTTWNTIATGVLCAVNRDTEGDESEVAERLTQHNKYIVHLPASTDVRAYDQILWQGKYMNVNNVFEPVSIETLKVVYASVFS